MKYAVWKDLFDISIEFLVEQNLLVDFNKFLFSKLYIEVKPNVTTNHKE